MEQVLIITGIAIAAFALIIYVLKKLRFKKMVTTLQMQDFDTFFKLADAKTSKYLFPRFNLEYLKLNANILRADTKQTDASFDLLMSINMTTNQKDDVYMKAFNYYVSLEDKKKTKELMEVIETFKNEELVKEARTIYDIFILKKANYIEIMEDTLEDMDDAQRGITEYLLSVQYANIKDKKKAEEYLQLSREHLKAPDEATN